LTSASLCERKPDPARDTAYNPDLPPQLSDGFLQQARGIASPPNCRNVTPLLKSPTVSAEMVLPGEARQK